MRPEICSRRPDCALWRTGKGDESTGRTLGMKVFRYPTPFSVKIFCGHILLILACGMVFTDAAFAIESKSRQLEFACDELAASPRDPERLSEGVDKNLIVFDQALKACMAAIIKTPGKSYFNLYRIYDSVNDIKNKKKYLDLSIDHKYSFSYFAYSEELMKKNSELESFFYGKYHNTLILFLEKSILNNIYDAYCPLYKIFDFVSKKGIRVHIMRQNDIKPKMLNIKNNIDNKKLYCDQYKQYPILHKIELDLKKSVRGMN
ncbi:MAG: hypothetical protein ACI9JL_002762 [Paracoccaceae bacterium]